jgi:hypothetical protein
MNLDKSRPRRDFEWRLSGDLRETGGIWFKGPLIMKRFEGAGLEKVCLEALPTGLTGFMQLTFCNIRVNSRVTNKQRR